MVMGKTLMGLTMFYVLLSVFVPPAVVNDYRCLTTPLAS